MSSIRIPKEARPGLHKIMEVDQTGFDQLIASIKKSKPALSVSNFIGGISQGLQEMDEADARLILRTVLPLYQVMEGGPISADVLATEISESATESSAKDFVFPVEKKALLGDRLQKLLGFSKSLGVTSKALDVMTEHYSTFCDARILSDIRPVFTDSAESASAGLIIHTLEIKYHRNNEHNSFYVALDNNDLATLKAVVARAEKKTKALRALITKSDIPCLEE